MWEWIVGFFAIPFVFYGLMLVAFIWMMIAAESAMIGSAMWALLFGVLVALVRFDSFGDVLTYVKTHPWDLVLLFLIYMFMGFCWSIFKWYLYVRERKDAGITNAPTLSCHKDRIIAWIIFWIPSMTWFVLNDPIRRLGNWIYARSEKLYQSITDSVYKSV